MVEPTKLARPLVKLVIQDLILHLNGSLKIGVVVVEDWTTWATFLTFLGYQLLQIHPPEIFRKLLQVDTLSVAEWLPPNQARRIINLQNTSLFVSGRSILSNRYG